MKVIYKKLSDIYVQFKDIKIIIGVSHTTRGVKSQFKKK